jgi:hypothetical protein
MDEGLRTFLMQRRIEETAINKMIEDKVTFVLPCIAEFLLKVSCSIHTDQNATWVMGLNINFSAQPTYKFKDL